MTNKKNTALPPVDIQKLPKFANPRNDNEKLMQAQFLFITTGAPEALAQMYEIGRNVCAKYITVAARKNPHVAALCKEDREEKAHNAITYVVERFLKVENFQIKKSFTAYLYLRVQHELFYHRKMDECTNYVGLYLPKKKDL